jgi:hypothetical protein
LRGRISSTSVPSSPIFYLPLPNDSRSGRSTDYPGALTEDWVDPNHPIRHPSVPSKVQGRYRGMNVQCEGRSDVMQVWTSSVKVEATYAGVMGLVLPEILALMLEMRRYKYVHTASVLRTSYIVSYFELLLVIKDRITSGTTSLGARYYSRITHVRNTCAGTVRYICCGNADSTKMFPW